MVLAVLCVGIFLIQLDVTVVNVALPAVRMDLHTGLAGQQWVVDGYMLALAGLLLLCGMLGDRIGHRRVVLAGLSVFGLASLACGTAPSIELLIAWRAVQGVGAALLLPGTLALITSLYADAAARARAMGLWAGAGALALPSGPLLGGALVHALGWRAVFLVNLPVIGLAMPIAYRLIPPTRSRGARVPRRLPAATAGAGCTPNSVGQPLTSACWSCSRGLCVHGGPGLALHLSRTGLPVEFGVARRRLGGTGLGGEPASSADGLFVRWRPAGRQRPDNGSARALGCPANWWPGAARALGDPANWWPGAAERWVTLPAGGRICQRVRSWCRCERISSDWAGRRSRSA